jgi:hypothetical protein
MAVFTICERCGVDARRVYVGPPHGVKRWNTLISCKVCGLYRPEHENSAEPKTALTIGTSFADSSRN